MRLIGLLLLVLGVALLAGCARRPASAWQPAEAEAVAWWIEDLSHSRPRQPGEVAFIGGSPCAETIATWAAGSSLRGTWEPPRRLAARRSRWPSIAAGLAVGDIVPAGESGLVKPADGLEPLRRGEVADLIDAENADRRLLESLVISRGHPDPAVERIFIDTVRTARLALDAVPAGKAPASAH